MPTIPGVMFLRVPTGGEDYDIGIIGSNGINLIESRRFLTKINLLLGQPRMVNALAHVAWRVNTLERWLNLPVTDFKLRDRVSQVAYSLDTSAVPVPDYVSVPSYKIQVDAIAQQFLTGGPSGKGAYRFYMYELFEVARSALAAVHGAMWSPAVTGHGAIYGTKWSEPVPPPLSFPFDFGDGWSGVPCLGGAYPSTPDSLALTDSTNWEFDTPPNPIGRVHYLPTENLKPDVDWNSSYFERLRYRVGTVPNANHWPADTQVLADFACRPNETTRTTRGIESSGNVTKTGVTMFTASHDPLRIRKDGGLNYGLAAFGRSGGVLNGFGSNITQYPRFATSTADRLGFWTPVTGNVWQLTIWDWICYCRGQQPLRIHAVGTLLTTIRVEPHYYTDTPLDPPPPPTTDSSTMSVVADLNGTALVSTSMFIAGVNPGLPDVDVQTIAFDVDVTAVLRSAPAAAIGFAFAGGNMGSAVWRSDGRLKSAILFESVANLQLNLVAKFS